MNITRENIRAKETDRTENFGTVYWLRTCGETGPVGQHPISSPIEQVRGVDYTYIANDLCVVVLNDTATNEVLATGEIHHTRYSSTGAARLATAGGPSTESGGGMVNGRGG